MDRDIFTSVPAEGAIVRDWTKETLILDVENSLGESFHFEISPKDKRAVPNRTSDVAWGACPIDILLPV